MGVGAEERRVVEMKNCIVTRKTEVCKIPARSDNGKCFN